MGGERLSRGIEGSLLHLLGRGAFCPGRGEDKGKHEWEKDSDNLLNMSMPGIIGKSLNAENSSQG